MPHRACSPPTPTNGIPLDEVSQRVANCVRAAVSDTVHVPFPWRRGADTALVMPTPDRRGLSRAKGSVNAGTTKTGAVLFHDFISTNEMDYAFGCPGTTETTFLAAIAGSAATSVTADTDLRLCRFFGLVAMRELEPELRKVTTWRGSAT